MSDEPEAGLVEIPLALSYDDVLLAAAPQPRPVGRDVSTRLTRNRLACRSCRRTWTRSRPAEMAIAMARAGGIGIVHRFLSVEEQVAEVARVKRAEASSSPTPTPSPRTPPSWRPRRRRTACA